MSEETTDLLMDVIQANRYVGNSYEKLSDAIDEFEDKYDAKGIDFCALVDWKTKTILSIRFYKKDLPGKDMLSRIIEDFKDEFNVELTDIIEEKNLKTSLRCFEYTYIKYIFQHKDRWNISVLKEDS